jgi:uncharacterized protein (DUF2141 family)
MLLCGCAQVGYLTGGEKDMVAPEPLRCFPANATTSFSENEIKLYFDEYIQLKNPQQNVFIVPNDTKIQTLLHKKTVALSWNEPLQANTTYVIYFNNAVADVTEENSTLFSYVFSTGTMLDTLSCTFRVISTETNKLMTDCTVGLFTSKDSISPSYFSLSDEFGYATFHHLKPGRYFVKAFQDENKDLKMDLSENCGFIEDSISISTAYKDTMNIQLFKPAANNWFKHFKYQAPGVFELELSQAAEEPAFILNEHPLDSTQFRKIDAFLYRIFPSDSIRQNNELVLKSGNLSQAVTLRISSKERLSQDNIRLTNSSELPIGKPILFQINSKIKWVDTNKINICSSRDSLRIIPYRFDLRGDLLVIWPSLSESDSIQIQFSEGAINSNSKSFLTTVELKAKKDLGTLEINPNGFTGKLVIELAKDKKIAQSARVNSSEKVLFEDLTAGHYTLKVIEDRNENGLWDTGDLERKTQPEKIYFFDTPVKIRPNWDIKLTLKPYY